MDKGRIDIYASRSVQCGRCSASEPEAATAVKASRSARTTHDRVQPNQPLDHRQGEKYVGRGVQVVGCRGQVTRDAQ